METTATETSETPVEEQTPATTTPDPDAELAKWKEMARKNEERAKANAKAAKELEKLREATATESEKAINAAKAEGRTEALSVANARIVKAELKAAASGVLQDPDDAVAHIDPSQFEVDDDGNVDTKAIKAEVARLAAAKPYLTAGGKPAPLPGGGAAPAAGVSMDDWMRGKG